MQKLLKTIIIKNVVHSYYLVDDFEYPYFKLKLFHSYYHKNKSIPYCGYDEDMRLLNLDGCYFRVERNGKFENICFSDLTADEMQEVLKNKNIDWLKSLCIGLGKTIKEIDVQLDIGGE